MPHMDMSGDMDAVGSDYSDFEYQHVEVQVEAREGGDTTGGGNIRVQGIAEFEPLDDHGGLSNNEVAELVYLETNAKTEFELEQVQQTPSDLELRGVVGINLAPDAAASSVAVDGTDSTDIQGTIVRYKETEISEANTDISARSSTEDRFLQTFTTVGSTGFQGNNDSYGGGGAHDQFYAEKNYRQLTGRGPVLDQSDDMGAFLSINANDTFVDNIASVRLTMIWDVAEVSDAGRAFSVPSDD